MSENPNQPTIDTLAQSRRQAIDERIRNEGIAKAKRESADNFDAEAKRHGDSAEQLAESIKALGGEVEVYPAPPAEEAPANDAAAG